MTDFTTKLRALLDASGPTWLEITTALLFRAAYEAHRPQRYTGSCGDAREAARALAKLGDKLEASAGPRPAVGSTVFVPVEPDDPCLIFDGSARPEAFVAFTVTEHGADGTFAADIAPDTEPFRNLTVDSVKRVLEPTDRLVKSVEDDCGNFVVVTVVR